MAKVIDSDTGLKTVSASYSPVRVALTGIVLGIVYYFLTVLLNKYFIKSVTVSGDVATILVATLGIMVMLRLRMAQPLIIAIASGAALWGLSQWTGGLSWGEVIAWNVILYGLAYILFAWIARYSRALPVLIAIVIVIIIVRIVSTL